MESLTLDLMIWLGIAVICGILEIFTAGFFFLFLAGGALVTAVVALFTDSWLIQGLVFAVSSLLLIVYARPLVRRTLNIPDKPRYESNVDALVGQEILVLERVDRYHGRVRLVGTGEIWTAYMSEGASEDEALEEGSIGVVMRVDGAKLAVLPRPLLK